MANYLTDIMPKILADGLQALREQAVMAQLVNRDLQATAQRFGNVINIPIPSAIPARVVTPNTAFASNVDASPTVALVTLDQWYEAPLNISDADQANVSEEFLTMQATEAVRSLANNVDSYILGKSVGFYNTVGVAGTTPFDTSLNAAAEASKKLNISLTPTANRRAVIDPSAEFKFRLNTNIIQFDQRGDAQGLIEGTIGRKLGIDWYMDQNVTTRTPGTAWLTGYTIGSVGATAGAATCFMNNATASGGIAVGDIFTIKGGTQQYVVKTVATAAATGGYVVVYPALKATYVSGDGVTLAAAATAAYTVNLAFHRDAMAFASRPLSGVFDGGHVFQAPTDPISGIALRLELSRQYKQETLSYDTLYGANIARREFGCIIMG